MNNENLKGKKIAILATNGFEQSELLKPRAALDAAGAETKIVSLQAGEIKGWENVNWGRSVRVDLTVAEADPEDFDGLLLPGGVMNPDKLRQDEDAVDFARAFIESGKPVAAICHGPQILVNADALRDRRVTSYPSIKQDLMNAGAEWVDEPVVVDNGLVTSRKPDDIPQFNAKMIEEFAEGTHASAATDNPQFRRKS